MRGSISGKESAMTLKKASRDTLLNWLVRSKKTPAREGKVFLDWGSVMYFSTSNCIVLMMKFVPFGVPTA